MKNYISSFDTTTEYQAAKETLDKPHVSLIQNTGKVYYDKLSIDYSNFDGYLRLVFENGDVVDLTYQQIDDLQDWQAWEGLLGVSNAKQAIFGTSCTFIPDDALNSMDNLGEVVISSTVEGIGNYAFPDTLYSITFKGAVAPEYNQNAFASQEGWGTVHFPPCVIQGYENWINKFTEWGWDIDYGHPTEYESNGTMYMVIDSFGPVEEDDEMVSFEDKFGCSIQEWVEDHSDNLVNSGSRECYFTGETLEYNGNRYYIWTHRYKGMPDDVKDYILTESADYNFLHSKSLQVDISSTYNPVVALLNSDMVLYRNESFFSENEFRIIHIRKRVQNYTYRTYLISK